MNTGYSGDQCQISVCDNEICNANSNMSGTCTIENGAAVCQCNGVYAGADCSVDACTDSGAPCVQGTCTAQSSGNGFYCDCNSGYIGTDCSRQECSGHGSKNNGACECESGFAGHHCDVLKIVCENDGVWMAPNDCTCVGDFTGERCEIVKVDCGTNGSWEPPNGCDCDDGFTGDIELFGKKVEEREKT